MAKCPRCGEIIAEGSESCPVCQAEFTFAEMKRMTSGEKAATDAQKKKDKAIRAKHNANMKIWMSITAILFMVALPVDAVLLATTRNDIFIYGIVVIVVLWLLSCGWAAMKKVFVCPFCGAPLVNAGLHTHCASCGKRIY